MYTKSVEKYFLMQNRAQCDWFCIEHLIWLFWHNPKGGPSQPLSGREEISQELRATTKSLASKIKAQIPRSEYRKLKDAAVQFCEGELSADDYHDIIVDFGIVQYAGALAAVCPRIQRGFGLFEVHRRFVKLASQVEIFTFDLFVGALPEISVQMRRIVLSSFGPYSGHRVTTGVEQPSMLSK